MMLLKNEYATCDLSFIELLSNKNNFFFLLFFFFDRLLPFFFSSNNFYSIPLDIHVKIILSSVIKSVTRFARTNPAYIFLTLESISLKYFFGWTVTGGKDNKKKGARVKVKKKKIENELV
jgi:hypothetical protein